MDDNLSLLLCIGIYTQEIEDGYLFSSLLQATIESNYK